MKILKCKAEKNGRRNEMERALAFGVGGKEREKGLNEELILKVGDDNLNLKS